MNKYLLKCLTVVLFVLSVLLPFSEVVYASTVPDSITYTVQGVSGYSTGTNGPVEGTLAYPIPSGASYSISVGGGGNTGDDYVLMAIHSDGTAVSLAFSTGGNFPSFSGVNNLSSSIRAFYLTRQQGTGTWETNFSVSYTPPIIPTYSKNTGLSANISEGTLSLHTPSLFTPFSGITLNGEVQSSYGAFSNWKVTDATGTGDGWHISIEANSFEEKQPTDGFISGTSRLFLPYGSLSLFNSRSITADSGSEAVSNTGGPNFVNSTSVVDTGTQLTIIEAKPGYGMGSYTIHEPLKGLKLTVDPFNVGVDTINYPNGPTPYFSTLTFTVATGP